MKIRFLVNKVVDDKRKGTADEERYQAGQVYDLPDKAAQHWLNRQVAEVVTDDEPVRDAPAATDDAAESDDAAVLLAGTVKQISAEVEKIFDLAKLEHLRKMEESGENRIGALGAIDHQIDFLLQQPKKAETDE